MTDYQPLNSAEEVQRAFAEGMYVQARQGDTNWLGAWPTDNLADIEKFFREGWTFRAPAKPPTPEAERRQGVTDEQVDAAVDAYDDVYEAEAVAGVWGDNKRAAMRAALTAVALSLPAAQDGGLNAPQVVYQATTASLQSAYFGDWSAALAWAGKNGHVTMHTIRQRPDLAVVPAHAEKVACDTCEGNGRVRGEIRCEDDDGSQDCGDCNGTGSIGTLPTPNAIRGDKGAEAVAWEMSYPKEMDTVSFIAAPEFVRSLSRAEYIASECLRLYGKAAKFREVIYAPTQAAAKDTP